MKKCREEILRAVKSSESNSLTFDTSTVIKHKLTEIDQSI